jgi:hypothetical protein
MINLKTLTVADLDGVQAICERAVKTAISNFHDGVGRLDELFQIAKVMEMLTMCRAADAQEAPEEIRQVPGRKKAA